MNTKNFITILFILSVSIAKAQFRLGIQTGLAKTSPTVKGLANPKGFTKIAPGLVIEFPLFAGLDLRPSIDYLKTQVQTTGNLIFTPSPGSTPVSVPTTNILNLSNIQIPLDLTLPIKLGKNKGKLLLMAGPTLNFAVKGSTTSTYTPPGSTTPVTVTNPINFSSSTVQFKDVDWGTRFGIGYRTKLGIDLLANYKLASDINTTTGIVQKNNILSLTASYFLIGRK